MNEGPESVYRSKLRRAQLLRSTRRYAEAETYLQQAVAERPEDPEGYYELAFCYCNWPGHSKKALSAIDRAIALNPTQAGFFALRAWILGNLKKYQKALEVADEALRWDSSSILALNAKVRTHVQLRRWADAEAYARRVLALDAGNEQAANMLALALRQQGRLGESEAVTASLLARYPDTADAQANAGWSALQAGDHQRANRHFLDALRLDPNDESARRGLLHSFNSRVWIYRLYFQVVAWLSRHRQGMRILFFLLIYVGYRFVMTSLRSQFGAAGVHWSVVLMAFYLILFGFGRSFGNFFLLLDRVGRHALTRKEKAWSCFAALVYAFLTASLISAGAWPQAGVLVAVVLIFLWGIFEPRFRDAFAYRSGAVDNPLSISSR